MAEGLGTEGEAADGTTLDAGFGLGPDGAWVERARLVLGEASLSGRLGPYEDVREIGRGGQGTVYRGVQPLTGRVVALKRVRPPAGEGGQTRFRAEIEALTRLSHPNVVTVLGAEEVDGHAVIVMEYVEGTPIDEWAATLRAGVPDPGDRVLAMFLDVCAGVAHAHQRGVIHRDLKPSNILVDRDARARVLDFGIARIVGEDRSDPTWTGFAGTPCFAAPEQLSGDPADVRTDVYALGLLLFELATGRRAFESGDGLGSLVDRIRAGLRTRPTQVGTGVSRDVDWVVARATAVDPSARYQTVEALARDVSRLMSGEAVEAHPGGRWYRIRRLARRHWLGVAAATLVAAAVVGSAVIGWRSSVVVSGALAEAREALGRESAARAEAVLEAAKQTEVNSLLREILRGGESLVIGVPSSMPMREAVERAAATVLERPLDPEVEATVRVAVGRALSSMAEFDHARTHLEAAIELTTATHGADDERTLEPLLELSKIARIVGDAQGAHRAQERIVSVRRQRTDGYGPVLLAQALSSLAISQRQVGLLEESAASLREAIDLYARHAGPQNESVGISLATLAVTLASLGRLDESEEAALRAIAILEAAQPDGPSPDLATAQRALGLTLARMGRAEEAEARLRQSIESAIRAGGGEPGSNASVTRVRLAELLLDQGRIEDARLEAELAAAFLESRHPPESPIIAELRGVLERIRSATGSSGDAAGGG